jgi:hypothetical protein
MLISSGAYRASIVSWLGALSLACASSTGSKHTTAAASAPAAAAPSPAQTV